MKIVDSFISPPLTRQHLTDYAQCSTDLNPIHIDPTFAARSPYQDVIVHGMLSMGFLGQYVERIAIGYHLQTFSVRFQQVVRLGDILTCTATVKEQHDQTIVLDISACNQYGIAVTAGEAVLLTMR